MMMQTVAGCAQLKAPLAFTKLTTTVKRRNDLLNIQVSQMKITPIEDQLLRHRDGDLLSYSGDSQNESDTLLHNLFVR